jgi:hypothetical protein
MVIAFAIGAILIGVVAVAVGLVELTRVFFKGASEE